MGADGDTRERSDPLDRLRSKLRELVGQPARILVGYSGGADSTCLVHLMRAAGADIVAAHLHHGQREEADQEEERCAAFAQEIAVPFLSGRADVPRIARERKIGLEEAGRDARYEFFRQAAASAGCSLIATAHTLDDHVETVILNLTRGAGALGLAGISESRNGIIRPILGFTRAETRSYCQKHGLWFHDDPSNLDPAFARSRIRLRVVPELQALNPGLLLAVERAARILSEESAFLDAAATAALETCELELNGPLSFLTSDCEIAFERGKLAHVPQVLMRRGFRLIADALGANLDFALAQRICEAANDIDRGSLTAEGGDVVIEWNSRKVHFRRLAPATHFDREMPVPGEIEAPELGWRLRGTVTVPSGTPTPAPGYGLPEASFDPALLRGGLRCRSVLDGDEIESVRIKKLLAGARLSEAARARLPIVCDEEGPLWAPALMSAERAAPSRETKTVFTLQLLPF